MNLEQYIGCVIFWRGREAVIVECRDCYDGCSFKMLYKDNSYAMADAFDRDFLRALPNPAYGLLKRKDKDVIFLYKDIEYILTDQPYEPCIYIKKDGKTICTLHNAFTVDDLPEWFAQGKSVTAINSKVYDGAAFCRVLAAAIDSGRSDMDFPFAANLVKTGKNNLGDI